MPDLAVSLPTPNRRRHHLHVPAAARDPLLERGAGQTRRTSAARSSATSPWDRSPLYGDPFADVLGGAACAARPRALRPLPAASSPTTPPTPSPFTSSPRTPSSSPDSRSRTSLAVPADTANHDIGLHPLPATGPYMWVDESPTPRLTLVRNPYFHELVARGVARTATPAGSSSMALSPAKRPSSPRSSTAPPTTGFDGLPPDRLADVLNPVREPAPHPPRGWPRRAATQYAGRAVQRCPGPPGDQLRDRPGHDRPACSAWDARPTCQRPPPYLPGYRPGQPPLRIRPQPGRDLARTQPAEGRAPHRRLAHARDADHDLEPRRVPDRLHHWTIEPYLVSLLDRLGYPDPSSRTW